MDVTDEQMVERGTAEIVEKYKRLDVMGKSLVSFANFVGPRKISEPLTLLTSYQSSMLEFSTFQVSWIWIIRIGAALSKFILTRDFYALGLPCAL